MDLNPFLITSPALPKKDLFESSSLAAASLAELSVVAKVFFASSGKASCLPIVSESLVLETLSLRP